MLLAAGAGAGIASSVLASALGSDSPGGAVSAGSPGPGIGTPTRVPDDEVVPLGPGGVYPAATCPPGADCIDPPGIRLDELREQLEREGRGLGR